MEVLQDIKQQLYYWWLTTCYSTQCRILEWTAWTEIADLNTARDELQLLDILQLALFSGGDPTPHDSITEAWDGTAWTELADIAARRCWQDLMVHNCNGIWQVVTPAVTTSNRRMDST
jgi:hypothetical protein